MSKTRILIVEDENIIALDIRRTLIKLGYEPIATLSTGEMAIEVAKKEKPDLILMDINLKGHLNGVEAAEIIISENKIPVIFLSALDNVKNFPAAQMVNASGHLLKPFEECELKQMLNKVCAKQV
ncbi:MAG: response regulator [Ignavibacteriaceae bacterium]